MPSIRARSLACALFALTVAVPFATAGEVIADPGCCRQPVVSRYDPSCDPCRVGPVRRFFRRVFCPYCPPPCPPRVAPVIVPPPPAAVWVPPAAPPVGMERPSDPIPPASPPPATIPGTGSSLRREGVLTPATPPPPVRIDRMASRNGW